MVATLKRQIKVVDYDPGWELAFASLSALIWPVVEGCALRIEHVGSTSVVGLAAKPIIDIDIVVADPGAREKVISALAAIGYIHRGNLGIEGWEAFRAPESDLPLHNLYVCLENCIAFKNHIAVREFLRANPDSAHEYSALKKQLAARTNDIEVYVDGKTDFLIRILEKQGFATDELMEIDSANRKKQGSRLARQSDECKIGQITVRRAFQDDADNILALHMASIKELCSADYSQEQIDAWTANRLAAGYKWAMSEGGESMFVALAEDRIVGFASFRADEVCAVYVSPDHAGRGVGRVLLKTVEQQMKSNGITIGRLSSTLTAKGFYEANGWLNTGGPIFERRGGVDIPCLAMTKAL